LFEYSGNNYSEVLKYPYFALENKEFTAEDAKQRNIYFATFALFAVIAN